MDLKFNKAPVVVCKKLKSILNHLPHDIKVKDQEIRLRVNRPGTPEKDQGVKIFF